LMLSILSLDGRYEDAAFILPVHSSNTIKSGFSAHARLKASDGSCCHAVCIHGGYVYDANETVALPLCDEALNYCTSTPLVKSTFVGFRRGYIFCYEGQRKQKLARMTLQA
jgi:hypothetical protein